MRLSVRSNPPGSARGADAAGYVYLNGYADGGEAARGPKVRLADFLEDGRF